MVEIYKKIRYVKFNFIYTGFYMFSFLWLIFLLNLEGDIFEKVGYNNNKNNNNNNNILSTAWGNEINGTNNSDNITGTQSKDIIKGLNGNDTITGKEAGDDISGGSGDDIIFGNEGRDILRGKAGNDRIEGEKGNDRIYGDRGNDILIGGSGNDTFTGGIGRDVFICSTGNDTITDFNITQNDTTPQQNDCEKIRYDNTDYYISFQQKQEDKQYEEAVDRSVHIENTIEDDKYEPKKSGSNNGFFFGLFK
jgi:Ca2+-binding RTX toxin-like protein